jgi:hypothetical protein
LKERSDEKSVVKKGEENQMGILISRIDKLEKSFLDLNSKVDKKGGLDISLELDNNLSKSEMFKSLKKDVDDIKLSIASKLKERSDEKSVVKKGEEDKMSILISRIDKLEKNFLDLSYKIDKLPTQTVTKKVVEEKKEEKTVFVPQTQSRISEDLGTYVSILTKLSLGVSMLALLFVAR